MMDHGRDCWIAYPIRCAAVTGAVTCCLTLVVIAAVAFRIVGG